MADSSSFTIREDQQPEEAEYTEVSAESIHEDDPIVFGHKWRRQRDEARAEVERLREALRLNQNYEMRSPEQAFPPQPQTLAIARQIRMTFGHGGANFPGARELYQAADEIERWAAASRTTGESSS